MVFFLFKSYFNKLVDVMTSSIFSEIYSIHVTCNVNTAYNLYNLHKQTSVYALY